MKNQIRSIGVLNGVNNTMILTPVFEGNMHASKVRVTKEEYEKVKDNKELMKELAINKLYK